MTCDLYHKRASNGVAQVAGKLRKRGEGKSGTSEPERQALLILAIGQDAERLIAKGDRDMSDQIRTTEDNLSAQAIAERPISPEAFADDFGKWLASWDPEATRESIARETKHQIQHFGGIAVLTDASLQKAKRDFTIEHPVRPFAADMAPCAKKLPGSFSDRQLRFEKASEVPAPIVAAPVAKATPTAQKTGIELALDDLRQKIAKNGEAISRALGEPVEKCEGAVPCPWPRDLARGV